MAGSSKIATFATKNQLQPMNPIEDFFHQSQRLYANMIIAKYRASIDCRACQCCTHGSQHWQHAAFTVLWSPPEPMRLRRLPARGISISRRRLGRPPHLLCRYAAFRPVVWLNGTASGLGNLQGFVWSVMDTTIFAQQFVTLAELRGLLAPAISAPLTHNAEAIGRRLDLPQGASFDHGIVGLASRRG